jgi:hypothetical protein
MRPGGWREAGQAGGRVAAGHRVSAHPRIARHAEHGRQVIHIPCRRAPRANPHSLPSNTCSQRSPVERGCSFPGCNRAHRAKGLCRSHYSQQASTGTLRPLGPKNKEEARCTFDGCGKAAVNKGLCQAHANQRRKGQQLRPLRPFYGTKGPCRFDGCSNLVQPEDTAQDTPPSITAGDHWLRSSSLRWDATSLAARSVISHLDIVRVTGDSYRRSDHSWLFARRRAGEWTGVTSSSSNPTCKGDGGKTGAASRTFRGSASQEWGNRSDNRPENLELWARGMQPPGSRVSDLIDVAIRVLKLYRPELLATSASDPNEVETKGPHAPNQ